MANFPIIEVLRSLFNITCVDQASDSNQVITCFTNQISKSCCKKRYRLVISDYNIEGVSQMSKMIRVLTKLRVSYLKSKEPNNQSDMNL